MAEDAAKSHETATVVTPEVFSRWPSGRLDLPDATALVHGAIANGHLTPPVYLVGECTTYDIPHGHPAFGGAVHDFDRFAIWGAPSSRWARVTTMRVKGILGKRVVSTVLPEFDHVELSEVPTPHGGYLDVQMSHRGIATARIGFLWSYGYRAGREGAHAQAEAFADALMRCREGKSPNA